MAVPDTLTKISQSYGDVDISGSHNLFKQGVHISSQRKTHFNHLLQVTDNTSGSQKRVEVGPTLAQPLFHWP